MKTNDTTLIKKTDGTKGMNPKGFTLIELLVVIAIIAILAVIGLTLFQGQQVKARDAARKADIDAVAAALESRFDSSLATYPALDATMLASGQMPSAAATAGCGATQPLYAATSTLINPPVIPAKPALWSGAVGACTAYPGTPAPANWSAWNTMGAANPQVSATAWELCTRIEVAVGASNIYCRVSGQ